MNAIRSGRLTWTSLIERITAVKHTPESIQEKLQNPVIGLMPGSRRNEFNQMLPVMMRAAHLLRVYHMYVSSFLWRTLAGKRAQLLSHPGMDRVRRDQNYEVRRIFTLASTKSGTSTVENALLGIPMAVVYRTGRINMYLGRRFVRIPYIGMVNLIAQKGICPEFIQEQFQPRNLVRFTEEILCSPARYQEMIEDLSKVREKMGHEPASERTAQEILKFLQEQEQQP